MCLCCVSACFLQPPADNYRARLTLANQMGLTLNCYLLPLDVVLLTICCDYFFYLPQRVWSAIKLAITRLYSSGLKRALCSARREKSE
jgi:hypothetical protein